MTLPFFLNSVFFPFFFKREDKEYQSMNLKEKFAYLFILCSKTVYFFTVEMLRVMAVIYKNAVQIATSTYCFSTI